MKVAMDKDLTLTWEEMPEWYGNPALNYECYGKKFQDGTKVYVFGLEDKHKVENCITDFNYVVKGEYTGMFRPDTSALELMNYVDFRYKLGILSHGRVLTSDETKKFKQLYNH